MPGKDDSPALKGATGRWKAENPDQRFSNPEKPLPGRKVAWSAALSGRTSSNI
jgi:hypothetical protein